MLNSKTTKKMEKNSQQNGSEKIGVTNNKTPQLNSTLIYNLSFKIVVIQRFLFKCSGI